MVQVALNINYFSCYKVFSIALYFMGGNCLLISLFSNLGHLVFVVCILFQSKFILYIIITL